jgi:hypothetical protein
VVEPLLDLGTRRISSATNYQAAAGATQAQDRAAAGGGGAAADAADGRRDRVRHAPHAVRTLRAGHRVRVRRCALLHRLAVDVGLVAAIDRRLHLLKIHRPYHESDHVLNLAFNALCEGTCLEDIELRRNDEAHLDALGAETIPDPTTAASTRTRSGR